jgi:hypothetical protein
MKFVSISLVAVSLFAGFTKAWFGTGHLLVARIAYNVLL